MSVVIIRTRLRRPAAADAFPLPARLSAERAATPSRNLSPGPLESPCHRGINAKTFMEEHERWSDGFASLVVFLSHLQPRMRRRRVMFRHKCMRQTNRVPPPQREAVSLVKVLRQHLPKGKGCPTRKKRIPYFH